MHRHFWGPYVRHPMLFKSLAFNNREQNVDSLQLLCFYILVRLVTISSTLHLCIFAALSWSRKLLGTLGQRLDPTAGVLQPVFSFNSGPDLYQKISTTVSF